MPCDRFQEPLCRESITVADGRPPPPPRVRGKKGGWAAELYRRPPVGSHSITARLAPNPSGQMVCRRVTLVGVSRLWLALLAVVCTGARRDPSSRLNDWRGPLPQGGLARLHRTYKHTDLPTCIGASCPEKAGSSGSDTSHWSAPDAPPSPPRKRKTQKRKGNRGKGTRKKRGRDIPSHLARGVLASLNVVSSFAGARGKLTEGVLFCRVRRPKRHGPLFSVGTWAK